MARKTKAPLPREVTRRRLARWQRERRRRRITLLVGALVIAAIAVIVGYGIYASVYAPAREWVTKVGTNETATVFRSSDYVDALRLVQLGFYSPGSLTPAEDPLIVLESNELVRQAAEQAGIADVTDEELTDKAKEALFPDEEVTDEEYRQALQQIAANTGLSESEFLQIVKGELLAERLDEYLREQVPEVGDILPQAHLQAITASTQEEADEALGRLNAGESFADLVAEYGGGDVGWVPYLVMSPEVEAAVSALEIGNVTGAVATESGYSILQLLGTEDRALEEEAQAILAENAFSNWLGDAAEERVHRNPGVDWNAKYNWALEQLS